MAVTLEDLLETAWGGVLTQEQLAYVLWLLNSPPQSSARPWVDEIAIAVHQATFVDGEATTELDANPALWIGSGGPPDASGHFINYGPEGFVVLPNLGPLGRAQRNVVPGQTIRTRLGAAAMGVPVMELQYTRWNIEDPTIGTMVELANYRWCQSWVKDEVLWLRLPESASVLVFADRPLPPRIKANVAVWTLPYPEIVDEYAYAEVRRQRRHEILQDAIVLEELVQAIRPALEAENAGNPAALDAIDTIWRNPTPATAAIIAVVEAAAEYKSSYDHEPLFNFVDDDFDLTINYVRLEAITQRYPHILAPLQRIVDRMISPPDLMTLPLPGI